MLERVDTAPPARPLSAQLPRPGLWLFLSVLGFYLATLAPSLVWGDGARLQMDVMMQGSTYWFLDPLVRAETDGWPFDRLGVAAWDHPLYVMLGQVSRALPWREPLWHINLISALAGALTVALIYRTGCWLTGDRRAAVLGALALAVSHTFWFHAVTAEVYTLHSLFMTAVIGLTLRAVANGRWQDCAAMALLAGLGLANHIMLALTLLPAAVYLAHAALAGEPVHAPADARISFRALVRDMGVARWAGLAVLFLAGLAPWWVQFVRMARVVGMRLTLELAGGFPWLGRRAIPESLAAIGTNLLEYAGWLLYQFTPVGVALGIWGFLQLSRFHRPAGMLLIGVFLLHVAFSANYSVADRFSFNLGSFVVFALAISVGAARLLVALSRRSMPWRGSGTYAVLVALILSPAILYAAVPGALRALGFNEQRLGIPSIGTGNRDGLAYFLNPDKRMDDSAMRFGRSTIDQVAANALVFTAKPSDQEAFVVLRYFQLVEGRRRDVQLELMLFATGTMPDAVLTLARGMRSCRPLYLASLDPRSYPIQQLRAEFDIVPEANLYRLKPTPPALPGVDCAQPRPGLQQVPLTELVHMMTRW